MKKMNLTDAWSVSGTGLEGLKEAISDIAERTEIIPFCNKTAVPTDGIYTLQSYDKEKDLLIMSRDGKQMASMRGLQEKIDDYADFFVNEIMHSTKCMIRNENVGYFLSEYAYLTLTQRVGMGTSISDSSFERDRFLERRMKNGEENWTICVRKDGVVKKIFGCFTSEYSSISQKIVSDLCEAFAGKTDIGSGIVGAWTISHTKTQVDVAFPDAATEISGTYGKENYTPTVRIITSDIGHHPFCIQALLVKSTGREILIAEQNIRHRGKRDITTKFVMNKVEKVLYPEFTKLPSQLMALTMIPVENPETFIDMLAKKGGFAKVLGKDLSAKMTSLLKGTVNPKDSYNAYDIVSMFMELPEKIGGIPEYLTEPFSKLCGSVPYVVSVPDLTPEPELYLM